MATMALPRIKIDQDKTIDSINVTNDNLVSIRETIDNMSIRLNIKLGSIANMISDFIGNRGLDAKAEIETTNSLYGINVKLGSIAMILSTMLEENRDLRLRDELNDNNDEQSRPPPKDKKSGFSYNGDILSDASGWASKIAGGLLTAIGISIVGAKFAIGDALEESGVIAYITRALTKTFILSSGITKMVDWLVSNPFIGKILGAFKVFGKALNALAHHVIPFYGLAGSMARWAGKLLPFVAFVTTVIDFMRGFNSAENAWDGVKEGIANVAAGWIGWPLEILKDIVAWTAGQFGFEKFKEILDSFDLVETIKASVRSIFDSLYRIFDFTNVDWSDWRSALPKITDIVFNNINIAVNLFKDVFNVGDQEHPFSMSEFLGGIINDIVNKLTNVFNIVKDVWNEQVTKVENLVSETIDNVFGFFEDSIKRITDLLPSVDEVVARFKSYLPEWMVGKNDGSVDVTSIDKRLAQIEKDIAKESDKIRRSEAGQNAFWGSEKNGRNNSLNKIKEANRVKEELLKEREKSMNRSPSAPNITVIKGGDSTTNASSVSFHHQTSNVSGNRPD